MGLKSVMPCHLQHLGVCSWQDGSEPLLEKNDVARTLNRRPLRSTDHPKRAIFSSFANLDMQERSN